MHIQKLNLIAYRGAKNLSLELHPQLNVFVGMNGSGKSTTLDATAILLSWFANRIKHASSSGRPIAETDIKNDAPMAMLETTCSFVDRSFTWNIIKIRKGYVKKDNSSILVQLTEIIKVIQLDISENNGNVNLPLLAYYPVNRAVLDIPLRIRERHRFDLLSAYDGSLTSGANFRTFFEWFREREDLENENRRYVNDLIKPEDFQFPDPQLEAVRTALNQFLPEFSDLTVRRNPLRMEVKKNNKRLSVNQLSDGEKCLMAMVGDLARRMAIANPMRRNPLEGDGIILIDEIDLHLHPKWQRMVIPKFMEIFPNCQFLVSTHSPHVITHVQPENLFLLRMSEEGLTSLRPSESYGKTVERVLEDLMGLETTRPDDVNDSFRQIYEQIDDGALENAKKSIGELEDLIGEDPDLAKAAVLIKRKELIGK
ncbi:MAG: AAA family ATPase [Desulfuromonadales bacterium]|nr:AAA family ATPase [Desulfuromonadales bacterium]